MGPDIVIGDDSCRSCRYFDNISGDIFYFNSIDDFYWLLEQDD